MPSSSNNPATLVAIAHRLAVGDLEQALAFYALLDFHATSRDESFAIVERDGVNLHFNAFDELPKCHSVCWIAVTTIDALYQQCLPTNAVQSPLESRPRGLKEFFLHDPFGNLLLFAERLPDGEAGQEQGT